MIYCFSGPVLLALNSEMVVAQTCQTAVSVVGFKQSLRHLYTRGNTVNLLVFNSVGLVFLYILLTCHLLPAGAAIITTAQKVKAAYP